METNIPTPQNPISLPLQGETLQGQQDQKTKKPLPKLKLAALIILLLLIVSLPFGAYIVLGQLGIHPKPSTFNIKLIQ
jgi:hypothetical protein